MRRRHSLSRRARERWTPGPPRAAAFDWNGQGLIRHFYGVSHKNLPQSRMAIGRSVLGIEKLLWTVRIRFQLTHFVICAFVMGCRRYLTTQSYANYPPNYDFLSVFLLLIPFCCCGAPLSFVVVALLFSTRVTSLAAALALDALHLTCCYRLRFITHNYTANLVPNQLLIEFLRLIRVNTSGVKDAIMISIASSMIHKQSIELAMGYWSCLLVTRKNAARVRAYFKFIHCIKFIQKPNVLCLYSNIKSKIYIYKIFNFLHLALKITYLRQ